MWTDLSVAEIRGARVAEIRSGTGRIVGMLAAAGARDIVAIEPSEAFEVLTRNTAHLGKLVMRVKGSGHAVKEFRDLDLVVSIGVIHHIPDPTPILCSALAALRPGGKILVWAYAREGNGLYCMLVRPLRALTTRLPHRILACICAFLTIGVDVYVKALRIAPVPMRTYLREIYQKLEYTKRKLVIYDQLNPCYARYYRATELRRLLGNAGFIGVTLHHRHGYSWTAVGTKPIPD